MIIKNIGTKIVNIGTLVLMPDATAEISEETANTPAVKMLVDMKFLKLEGGKKAAKAEAPVESAETTSAEEKTEDAPAEPKPEKKATKKLSEIQK